MNVVLQLQYKKQRPKASPTFFFLPLKIRNMLFHQVPIKTKFTLELKKKKNRPSCKTLASVLEKQCLQWKVHRFAPSHTCYVEHIFITFFEIYQAFDLADFLTDDQFLLCNQYYSTQVLLFKCLTRSGCQSCHMWCRNICVSACSSNDYSQQGD